MNKTKRVNAGIKSPADLAVRLEAGEVFWDRGNKIYYDESFNNPFRYGVNYLRGAWARFAKFEKEIETPWYENIPEQGVLCGDKYGNVIVFFGTNPTPSENTTPLTREECLALCYEEQNK